MNHLPRSMDLRPRALAHSLLANIAAAGLALAAPAALAQELRNEKYTLPNGMTVILHEDHAVPRACVNIWYRVGARNEPPGRSGFAHLFEHLMFMGTKRVPGSDFDVLMETGGGANNASTSLDRTNYYSSGPSSLLPTLLWLDADRLEDMGLMMNAEKLKKQLDVVRNERRQTTENAPYGKAYDASSKLLYPPNHPYYNGVIGTHQDLEAAQVQDVKDFFSTYYQPNNASLVVAGDFDPAVIKPMIDGLFGTLPRGNVAPQATFPTPKLDRVIRQTSLDKVELPAFQIAYHSPAQFSEGDAEMDIVGGVLADGNGSRLYQRLVVQEQLAAEVGAGQDSSALSSVFRVNILAKPGADMARVEAVVDEELAKLVATGPTTEELERMKAKYELGIVSGIQSVESRADRLNQYEYSFGNPDSLQTDLNRYRNATPQSVQSWAKAVLRPGARVIQVVLPEEPERAAAPRDKRPADIATKPYTPPTPETFDTASGMKVMVFARPGLPLVTMQLSSRPGGALDASTLAGRTTLMATMLEEGPVGMTSKEFADSLSQIGASFNVGTGQESLSASMTVLKRGLDRGAELFAGAITKPRMDQTDFDRVKSLHLDALKQADEEPRSVAGKVAARMLYGMSNPYGTPASGTVKTTTGLTLDAVKQAHASNFQPGKATLVIAGDVTLDEAKAMVQKHFAGFVASPNIAQSITDFSVPSVSTPGMRVYVVDRPAAVQTVLSLRAPSVKYADSNRVQLDLLNTILGGSFTSRLNQNLREKNGYSYGVRSQFNLNPSLGFFSAATSVKAEQTGPALKEFLGEITKIRTGDISADEAKKARETARADMIGNFGTINTTAGVATEAAINGMPWSSVAQDLAATEGVQEAVLNALAKTSINLDQSVLVLVGDKDLVLEQIKDLRLPPATVVNAEGEVQNAGR